MVKTDFAGVIKLRISRWRDYTRFSGCDPNAVTCIPMIEREKF